MYPELHARLRAKGLPVPNQRGTGTSMLFPFTVNAAVHPLPNAGPGQAGAPVASVAASPSLGPAALDQARRLLREAEDIAQSIPNGYKRDRALAQVERATRDTPGLAAGQAARSYLSAQRWQSVTADSPDHAEVLARDISDKSQKSLALASVAVEVANVGEDPDRVVRLLSEAEDVALSIRFNRYRQSQALHQAALAVAAVDVELAVRFASSIRSKLHRSAALADLARKAAGTSPHLVARLLSEAEKVALSIRFNRYEQSHALAGVARAHAVTDSRQAGRVALSIRAKSERADCLAEIAQVFLAADPDQAEHLARAIPLKPQRASALACMARDFPVADADRVERLLADAERAVESIFSLSERASVLARVAFTIVGVSPERAERFSLALSDPVQKAHILACIAQTMPPGDPRRARLVADICQVADSAVNNIWMDDSRLSAVRDIAEAIAATDADEAVRFARSIRYSPWEAYVVACAAHGLATVDLVRADRLMSDAERIVRAIPERSQRVTILVLMAEAWARGTRPDQKPYQRA